MKRASKRIVVTSENVNRYGFRVLTDGIDLTQYDKNPLMLWMHIRAFSNDAKNTILALGNVVELKREVHPELGKVITGLPVFDETDEFAMRIYNKYENGTYRMASAGLIPVEWSEDPAYILSGQRAGTLVKSIMEEISLADIGANDDALSVALYDKNHQLIQLSLNGDNAAIPLIQNPLIEIEMSKIELTAEKAAVLLGLRNVGTSDEFETKVLEVVQLSQKQKTQIETLTKEKEALELKISEADKVKLSAEVEAYVQTAVDARKITADEKAHYVKLGALDFETVKLTLDAKVGAQSVEGVVNLSKQSAEAIKGKSWDELDKNGGLVQLKSQNLPVFKELYKTKFNKEYVG